jgi:hypothetical protein
VRKIVTFVLVVAVIAIAAAASLDAFRASRPEGTTGATEPASSPESEATTARTPTAPPAPIWEAGLQRRVIRLGHRAPAEWEETRMLDPGSFELTMRLSVPHDANVEVWLRSGTSLRIGLFDRRVPRDCRGQRGRDVCTLVIPFPQENSEEWTLVVAKWSRGQAVVRLTFAFTRIPPPQS